MNTRHLWRTALILLMASVASIALAACGGSNTGTTEAPAGNSIDVAFAEGMIPHHKSAVEMAEIARERSNRKEIKTLADNIIKSQNAEIVVLEKTADDIKEAGVTKGDLGVSDEHMGMSMDAGMLRDADPFDQAFIDMMVPHHRGAVAMAQVELSRGKSPALKKLAEEIITAQTQEIAQMRDWRKQWYGSSSPSTESGATDHSGM